MWKRVDLLKLGCALLLLLPGISGIAQTEPVLSTTNTVIAIEGAAAIHRTGWNGDASEPLTVGESVESTDVILPIDFARVTVLCADGTISVIFQLSSSPNCGETPPSPTDLLDDVLSPTRGALGAPQILTPIGRIAAPRPVIRWTQIETATRYSLRVSSTGADAKVTVVWEQRDLTTTLVAFPDDVEPLAPGNYTIVVRAYADADEIPGSELVDEITVIPQSEVKNLEREFAQRSSATADNSISQFIKARLYADRALYSDAIISLEAALDIPSDNDWTLTEPQQLHGLAGSPAPYLFLGDWYRALGVSTFAQRYFQAALEVANIVGKPSAAAQARIALAEFQSRQRARFCMVMPAIESLKTIEASDVLLDQAQQIADDAERLLGYTPTCVT